MCFYVRPDLCFGVWLESRDDILDVCFNVARNVTLEALLPLLKQVHVPPGQSKVELWRDGLSK